MKRAKCLHIFTGEAGFSFIEIAIALIIIGMLSGAGLLLFGKITDSTQRKETVQRMHEAKNALLLFAEHQGKLPAEADYYQKIGSSPVDTWQQPLSYKVAQANVITPAQYDVCKRLKSSDSYTGWLALDDQVNGTIYPASGTGEKIVALLLSGGARDADSPPDGKLLDSGNAGNAYVRKIPSETFDDLVVAITAGEMYGAIKEKFCTATVTVSDIRDPLLGGGLYFVHSNTTNADIGSANLNQSVTVRVPFDEKLVIRDTANAILKAETTITANPTTISLP